MPANQADLFTPKPRVWSVGEFTLHIKELLEETFVEVTVEGEISQAKRAASGHVYLTLKDAEAVLPCVIWRTNASRLRFELPDGLAVTAKGSLSVYPPHGKYQLDIRELSPVGQGALELAFRQLKEKLEKRGWFSADRKKPLPPFPVRLALVTSPSGAALRDMLKILGKRWPAVEVILCPALVQGQGAAESIAAAIQQANQLNPLPDLLIVGRGGGSLEDLWAFNEEQVAHALFHSRIPTISAVGHESDVTIADLVADRRAATPSEAAEIAVPDRAEILRSLQQRGGRAHAAVQRLLAMARQRWQGLASRRCFTQPGRSLQFLRQRLDDWAGRAERAVRQTRERQAQRLHRLVSLLEGLSPLKVLARGYCLAENVSQNRPIRGTQDVKAGDSIRVRLQQGSLLGRVERIEE